MSIEYYNENSSKYIENTVNADMGLLYEKFEQYLQYGDLMLDLGCGSGRDTKYFLSKGYEVVSVDASSEMISYCKSYLTNQVYCSTFEEYNSSLKFNAIWACASLLHVKRTNLVEIINKYIEMLKCGGVFFMSFKMKEYDYEKDGRTFTCFTKNTLIDFISNNFRLDILDVIETTDVREGKSDEYWVSIIVRNHKMN